MRRISSEHLGTAEAGARLIVYAVVDDALSPDFPLGDALELFIRRENAERLVEEVRATIPKSRPNCASRSVS